MRFFSRAWNVLARLLRGEDVILVAQDQAAWERQYAEGSWDRLAAGEAHSSFLAGLLLDLAAGIPRFSVLDVGCGNGGLARLLALADGRVGYHGLDISETAVKTARTAAPHGAFHAAPAETPPAGLGPFDAIVFADVLYYIDPGSMAARYSSIAPDAIVLISVFRFWRSWFVWRRIKRSFAIERSFTLAGARGPVWDIAVARFKNPS